MSPLALLALTFTLCLLTPALAARKPSTALQPEPHSAAYASKLPIVTVVHSAAAPAGPTNPFGSEIEPRLLSRLTTSPTFLQTGEGASASTRKTAKQHVHELFDRFASTQGFNLSQRTHTHTFLFPGLLETTSQLSVQGACDSAHALCKPCKSKADFAPGCADWEKQCKKLNCIPLCTQSVYDVVVTSTSDDEYFTENLKQEKYQLAMNAVGVAIGCQENLGCCEEGGDITEWTEARVYSGYYAPAMLPIPSCALEDRAEACEKCKISAEVKLRPKACDFFFKPDDPSPADPIFAGAGISPPSQATPGHKSFNERCNAVKGAVSGAIGAIKSAVEAKGCGCLGCCDAINCDPWVVAYSGGQAAKDDGAEPDEAKEGGDDGGDGEGGDDGGDGGGDDGGDGGGDDSFRARRRSQYRSKRGSRRAQHNKRGVKSRVARPQLRHNPKRKRS